MRSPAILKHISTGLRIKHDVGDGDLLYFIRKDEILRSRFANLRTISCKKTKLYTISRFCEVPLQICV